MDGDMPVEANSKDPVYKPHERGLRRVTTMDGGELRPAEESSL